MADIEKVIDALDCLSHGGGTYDCLKFPCPYGFYGYTDCHKWEIARDALELLKEQENLLKEYEKLSQVCFKIEKYLRIADLSILIDRIEEGKVEVLQDDGRPDSMETTIKIRRL